MSNHISPASPKEARAHWKKAKMSLSRAAKKAFAKGARWGTSANGYSVVVSSDNQWAIGFAKRAGAVFAFDLFAYHPELRPGDDAPKDFPVHFS